MRPTSRGFTLIELVAVIVILGILAAVALPKYHQMTFRSRVNAAEMVAGAITTATALNVAAKAAGAPGAVLINQANVCSHEVLDPLIEGGIPSNYRFLGPNTCATFNETVNCTIGDDNEFTFSVYAVVSCAR